MALSRRTFLGGVAVAGLAGLGGYAVSRRDGLARAAAPRLEYTCSMHPQVRQDHPGTCPICNMNLVPMVPKAAAAVTSAAHVPRAAQRAAGVRTAPVRPESLARRIDAYASIGADESATVSVNPKVEGWLRRLAVHGPGQPIRRGQVLYEIYSPELQQRQRDYIDLLVRKDGLLGDAAMSIGAGVNAAMAGSLAKEKFRNRARLIAADMSEALIDEVERTRRVIDVVPVRAEHDGVVTAVGAHEGNYVNPMQQILAYADYRAVWAELTLYPDQLAWIRNGDPLSLRSGMDRHSVYRGRVDLNTLQVDPATRTARLRVRMAGAGAAFRPGAFADAQIDAGGQRALCVPRAAVLRTGHGDYVLVATDDEHFRRVRVTTGIENDDLVAIAGGLRAGERVAVDAQFLVDGALALQDTRAAGMP